MDEVRVLGWTETFGKIHKNRSSNWGDVPPPQGKQGIFVPKFLRIRNLFKASPLRGGKKQMMR